MKSLVDRSAVVVNFWRSKQTRRGVRNGRWWSIDHKSSMELSKDSPFMPSTCALLHSRGHFPVLGCLLASWPRGDDIDTCLEVQFESPGSLAGGSIRKTRRNTEHSLEQTSWHVAWENASKLPRTCKNLATLFTFDSSKNWVVKFSR